MNHRHVLGIIQDGYDQLVKEEPEMKDNINWNSYDETFAKIYQKVWVHHIAYSTVYGTGPTLDTFKSVFANFINQQDDIQ